MSKTIEQRERELVPVLLGQLAEIQSPVNGGGFNNGTSDMKISIGSVSETGMVEHGIVVIHEAPPVVIDRLVALGYSLSPDEHRKGVVVSHTDYITSDNYKFPEVKE